MLNIMYTPYKLDKAKWGCGYNVILLDLWEGKMH
jgi:hypothetical protein